MIKSEDILNALGQADEQYILEAAPGQRKKRRIRVYWGTAAALLCLIASLPFLMLSKRTSETPDKTGDSAPCVTVDGKNYIISPYLSTTENCPEGFLYAGQINKGFMKGCGYYVSPDIPEWVYVYQDTWENNTSGNSTSRKEYVRYVDERIRGKDLICYEGRLYISLWSAVSYGEYPDISPELYDKIREQYDIRIETDSPKGFFLAGTALFSGYDTVPSGPLSCNTCVCEILVNPEDEQVLLASTQWYTAPDADSPGEVLHTGYNVYVRWEREGQNPNSV